MYKCRLTYDEWKCITSKNRIGKQVDMPQIKGYIGLLTINSVWEKQIWKYNNKDVIDAQGYNDGVPYFYDL